MKGGLRLQGPATFANLVITPDAVDGLSPEPARDPLDGDRGLVRNWRLSPFSALPNGKDPMYDEMPGASQEWKTIGTERNGLVNLSREYGRPLPEPNRAVAWLKTTIASDRKQTKKVEIGWTRELWVFVNGKLVYADKNLFEVEGARKAPDARCSLENGGFTLPLEAGDNEVAVAIANNFFGWGLMLRLAIRKGFIWRQVTNPMAGKQWMKTRPGRAALAALAWTMLGCVFALPDLSSRRGPAAVSAVVSYALVVLGSGHASHSLGGPADPRFQQATGPASSGAFPSEPAGDVGVRLCFGGGSRRVRNRRMGRRGEYPVSCRLR